MLDDRVAVIARLLQPARGEQTAEARPGTVQRAATTPIDMKESAWAGLDCAQRRLEELNGAERWRLVRTRVRRLMRGDGGARECSPRGPRTLLHRDFWLEALDEQHRYGCYLRAFHKAWKHEAGAPSDAADGSSFFRWLDRGGGRAMDLPECSQEELRRSRVEYCSRADRRRYELRFVAPCRAITSRAQAADRGDTGLVAQYAESHALAHTDERSKWIFVVDLGGRMYLGRKRKGRFHHSSFVAGAPVIAAGKVVIKLGRILAIEPHSGHFKPQLASLEALRLVLEQNGVDVAAVAFVKPKKWEGEWPFPELEASVDLDDFGSDTDDGGGNAVLDTAADDEDIGMGEDDEEQWRPTSP